MPRPLPSTAPPARLAVRHGSGLCTVDAEVLNVARLMDEREHTTLRPGWPDGAR